MRNNNLLVRLLLLTACLLLSLGSGAAERQGKSFKWMDDEGNVHYGDQVPPQYSKQERKVIDEQGRTVKVYEAAKTPEERAEQERLAAVRAEEEKKAKERAARDRSLLSTYSSEEDMLLARDGRLAAVDAVIQLTRSRIKTMERNLYELEQEAAEFERSGKPPPVGLKQQASNLQEHIKENEKYIKTKEQEKQAITLKFNEDIARFRELRSSIKK